MRGTDAPSSLQRVGEKLRIWESATRESSIKGGNILMEIIAAILPSKGKLKHPAGYRDLPLYLGAVTLSPKSVISVLSLLCQFSSYREAAVLQILLKKSSVLHRFQINFCILPPSGKNSSVEVQYRKC